ncbi:hypothetical protein TIFTF001_012445 [Ficus carica]|uniref:Uncharacterized protein n=1 Tax=Ficus carica TaxID=3494 RepID=A0AA88A2C8_FICCA|nr:hypothetical protein TIFTF001_012445 [Ficus carica]
MSTTAATITASLPKKLCQPLLVVAQRSFCLSSFSTPLNAVDLRSSIAKVRDRTNVGVDLLHASLKQR